MPNGAIYLRELILHENAVVKEALQGEAVPSSAFKAWKRVPQTLQGQMELRAAMEGKGVKIIDKLADPRFKNMEKWEYKVKSSNGRDSVVHYVRDPATKDIKDFKFTKSSKD